MLHLVNFIDFCEYKLSDNNTLQLGQGPQKTGKVVKCSKNNSLENFAKQSESANCLHIICLFLCIPVSFLEAVYDVWIDNFFADTSDWNKSSQVVH